MGYFVAFCRYSAIAMAMAMAAMLTATRPAIDKILQAHSKDGFPRKSVSQCQLRGTDIAEAVINQSGTPSGVHATNPTVGSAIVNNG